MKNRLNGQGHHPKARPTFWTGKIKSRRKKLIKITLLSESHLVLMKKGEDFVVRKCDRLEEGISTIREEALLEPMIVEMGCTDAKTYYVDTSGCGMRLADPANSPPKNGFVRMMMRYAAVLLLSLMMLAWPTACTKPEDPNQNQNNQNDTIPETPVTPVKTHDTIYLNWDTAPTFGPHEDTIRNRLLKNPQLRELVIHIHGNGGINCPVNCTAVRPHMWPWAREELAQDIAIDDQGRIRLNGTFEITNGDAPNTDHGQEPGIATDDRLWFEANGIIFVLVNLNKGMAK